MKNNNSSFFLYDLLIKIYNDGVIIILRECVLEVKDEKNYIDIVIINVSTNDCMG